MILQTKLFKPAPRPSLIARQHLIDRLNEGLGHGAEGFAARLTLISAPAGFGKTTLVAAWLAQLAAFEPGVVGLETAWLSLDEGDNDVVRFLLYLIAALQTVAPAVGQAAKGFLLSPQPPPAERALTVLLNDLSEQEKSLVLVLDDYHVITNMAVHRALIYLLEHMPPRLHLVITTRRDPSLPLSRLRARSQMVELRAVDLRFTPEETQLFFGEVMGVTLSEETVAAVDQRTEGWAVGLQMAALSLRGRADKRERIAAFSGSHHFVIDYLTEEVLSQQPADVRDFLLCTSILERICGPLADALTSSSSGQEMLEHLEHSNLFLTPLDEERRWYRYHHLFAGVLRSRLREASAPAATLHHRASVWYEQEGLVDEAIAHALAGQDVARAGDLVAHHRRAMLQRSHILHLRTWLEQLPPEMLQRRPQLILARGWVLTFTGNSRAAEAWLATPRVVQALSGQPLPDDIRGELALLRATIGRLLRQNEDLFDNAELALRYLPEDEYGLRAGAMHMMGVARFRQGDAEAAGRAFVQAAALGELGEGPYMALVALQDLASIQIRQGRLSQIKETCLQAMELMGRWDSGPLPAAGMAHIDYGGVLYEQNDLDGAAQALREGIALLRGSTEPSLLAEGYIILARLQQAQGDVDGALTAIEEGEAWFNQVHVADLEAGLLLALGKARVWLAQGNVSAASRWAKNVQLWPEDSFPGYLQAVTLARVRLAEGPSRAGNERVGEAVQTVERLLATAESRGWWGHVIELSVLSALFCKARGDTARALSRLQSALALGETEGFCRIFLDEGQPMLALLREARQRGLMVAYVDQLLHAIARERGAMASRELLPEPLSERELEVLRLAATGASNKDIAANLFIALPTVKKHMGHILVKLDAKNRLQAVTRARKLGLL